MVADVREPVSDQVDFSDMLERFKQGIAENVSDEDHEAHYDLGVAYKEMGLLDEAIAAMAITPGGTWLDGTFGGGGHARRILEASAPDGALVAVGEPEELGVPVLLEASAAFALGQDVPPDEGLGLEVDVLGPRERSGARAEGVAFLEE